jgi:heme-degrading monooxygenase HmoA
MYARSNTLQGNPAAMDGLIAMIRDEVMPAVRDMDGCIGLSMLADRDSGRCIVTTAWASEEAMHASDAALRDSRARAAERFGSAAPRVEEWELALVHRAHETHDGAVARVLWSRAAPGSYDQALDIWRSSVLPDLERLDGFCSVSVLANRAVGRGVTSTVYDSREAMEANAGAGRALRERFTSRMEMTIEDMATFEVVLAHLRVPELV